MTKDKLKKLMDSGVLQAALDDLPLQYRVDRDSGWSDVTGFPDFNADYDFRIKDKQVTVNTARWGDIVKSGRNSRDHWVVIRNGVTSMECPFVDWDQKHWITLNDDDIVVL